MNAADRDFYLREPDAGHAYQRSDRYDTCVLTKIRAQGLKVLIDTKKGIS